MNIRLFLDICPCVIGTVNDFAEQIAVSIFKVKEEFADLFFMNMEAECLMKRKQV
jgi:hypothetical protein